MLDEKAIRIYLGMGTGLVVFPTWVTWVYNSRVTPQMTDSDAKAQFIEAFPALFEHYDFTWYLALFCAALAMFFGLRLTRYTKGSKRLAAMAFLIYSSYLTFFAIQRIF